jgi:hypothetical protein
MDADPPALLCAAFRRERGRDGKKLSELKSGLQKYIRRGEVDKALWCAGELFSFRDAPLTSGPSASSRTSATAS